MRSQGVSVRIRPRRPIKRNGLMSLWRPSSLFRRQRRPWPAFPARERGLLCIPVMLIDVEVEGELVEAEEFIEVDESDFVSQDEEGDRRPSSPPRRRLAWDEQPTMRLSSIELLILLAQTEGLDLEADGDPYASE
jgi:hypothetical protein